MKFILVSYLFLSFCILLITSDNRFEKFIYGPSPYMGDSRMFDTYYKAKDEFFTFNVPLPSENEDLIHPCYPFDPIFALCKHFPKREPLFPLDRVQYLVQYYDVSIFGVPQIYGYVRFKERSFSYTRFMNPLKIKYSNGTSFTFTGIMGPSKCTPILSRYHVINLTPTICSGGWEEWGQLYEYCDTFLTV